MTTPTTLLTNDVVERARTDSEAFGTLFDHFYSIIFAYCVKRLVVRASAEDVTSEVFLKVVTAFPGFPGSDIEEFRRWIFRIATNEINAFLRQTIRRRELLEAAVELGRINDTLAQETIGVSNSISWERVYAALEILGPRDKSLVSLRFFASLSHAEIGKTLNLRTGTVRVALNRALKKMREHLQTHQDESASAEIKGGTGK